MRPGEIVIHQSQNSRLGRCQLGASRAIDHLLGGGGVPRLEEIDVHVRNGGQGLFDQRADHGPIQPPQSATQRRDGDGPDALIPDDPDQVDQAGLDVFDPALPLPVPLGREVDDPAGLVEGGPFEDEHLAGTDLLTLGGLAVCLVVVLEGTAELESDPPAHHTHAIDGVDKGVRFVLQDVAVG